MGNHKKLTQVDNSENKWKRMKIEQLHALAMLCAWCFQHHFHFQVASWQAMLLFTWPHRGHVGSTSISHFTMTKPRNYMKPCETWWSMEVDGSLDDFWQNLKPFGLVLLSPVIESSDGVAGSESADLSTGSCSWVRVLWFGGPGPQKISLNSWWDQMSIHPQACGSLLWTSQEPHRP